MLLITIPGRELYNERTNEFLPIKATTLQLEHSLISVSRWEEKWNKPFLSKDKHPYEETVDYIRCMTITQNVNPNVYYGLTAELFAEIEKYIEATHTATWFTEDHSRGASRETITAEIIYHWMIANQIPHEYEKWHLNRLLTLIRVCSLKNTPPKKMSKKETLAQQRAQNNARRAAHHTRG